MHITAKKPRENVGENFQVNAKLGKFEREILIKKLQKKLLQEVYIIITNFQSIVKSIMYLDD